MTSVVEHVADFEDAPRTDDSRSIEVAEEVTIQLVHEPRPKPAGATRLAFVDLFRGIILVIMALDHVKHFFAAFGVQDPVPLELFVTPADYSGPVSWWLTREVTHLCAVGFAFTMGLGMHYFIQSRQRNGWSAWRIFGYYALRGALLIVIEQVRD